MQDQEASQAAPTHILVVHKSQKAMMLFRAIDGIMCGMQQEAVVVYGDDPNKKTSRTFIDQAHAEKWLRNAYPAKDLDLQGIAGEPVLEERNGEAHGLYVPDGSLELPGMAPIRRAN